MYTVRIIATMRLPRREEEMRYVEILLSDNHYYLHSILIFFSKYFCIVTSGQNFDFEKKDYYVKIISDEGFLKQINIFFCGNSIFSNSLLWPQKNYSAVTSIL